MVKVLTWHRIHGHLKHRKMENYLIIEVVCLLSDKWLYRKTCQFLKIEKFLSKTSHGYQSWAVQLLISMNKNPFSLECFYSRYFLNIESKGLSNSIFISSRHVKKILHFKTFSKERTNNNNLNPSQNGKLWDCFVWEYFAIWDCFVWDCFVWDCFVRTRKTMLFETKKFHLFNFPTATTQLLRRYQFLNTSGQARL